MGLDTVELVIRFEEAFGITISDEVATSITTPRAVTDYIVTQVPTAERSACLSQQAFYFLRHSFSNRLDLPRRAFHPDARLQNLFPKDTRKTVWGQLQTEMGPHVLPDLARPLWLFYLLSVSVVVLAGFVSYSTPYLSLHFKVLLALGLMTGFGMAVSIATRPFKTEFRRRFQTVNGLVDHVLLFAPGAFKREQRVWTRAQIAETVRAIIIDVTGQTNFTDDSHFIDDMHLD